MKPSLHNDSWCRSAWLDEMSGLLCSAMKNQWAIGDLALRTPPEASRDEVRELLEEAAARAGYEVNSIRDLRTVAERIPPELRNPSLSWYAHKEISKLSVSAGGKVNEDNSIALRREFIEKFAAGPARVLDIRSAVRARMGREDSNGDLETVSFKLTTEEHSHLCNIVEAHPVHESVSDFVQELVRNFLATSEVEVSQ